jgi:hypothetical protein
LSFSELSSQDLNIEPDGSFEIIASPDEQPGNWLPLHADVGWINIRQYFHDWVRQRPAEFFIERVGYAGTSPPPLSAARMADQLESAVSWVEHGMPYWTKWVQEEHLHLPPNTSQPLGFVADGVQMITYGRGRFDLEEGQAMIFECEIPVARYWQVALLNSPWFESLDYMDHQSCLNGAQIQTDPDGRFRIVVSREDPGVPNWLDTAGHLHGLVQYRWIWNESEPEPQCRVVPIDKVRGELPANTPVVDAQARQHSLARRREHVLRRFHLC